MLGRLLAVLAYLSLSTDLAQVQPTRAGSDDSSGNPFAYDDANESVAFESDHDVPITPHESTDGRRRLRVVIITEDDPLYVIEFFRVFFDEFPCGEIEVCGMTIDRAFHEPLQHTLLRMMRFYGWFGTFFQGVRFVKAKVSRSTIASLADEHGVTVLETESVNDRAYLDRVRSLRPDLIASVAGPEIFSSDLLELAPLGCINVHSGRLPTYRGMLPCFWQMVRGEPEVTITVHRMVEKLDAGDILATQAFPIRASDSLDRVIRGTKRAGARLFIEVLRDLRTGVAQGTPLDWSKAGYFRFPNSTDVRKFRRRGHKLL